MKKLILLAATVAMLTACNDKKKSAEPLADSGRTVRTEALLSSLKQMAQDGQYMFGHQDDPVYGHEWVGDADRSDVKSVCGDYPAVMGFDLGHLELGDSANLDGVPFSRMRQEIISQFERGGVVTLSWHLNNPLSGGTAWVADSLKDIECHTVEAVLPGGEKHELFLSWIDRVAEFLNSLVTSDGTRVPVVFRPWHEHTGSWFWWGQDNCTTEQYVALWHLTEDRLREQGVVNALYAFSPNQMNNTTKATLMERYPGDDLVDIIGYDQYCSAAEGDTVAIADYAAKLDTYLGYICEAAQEHGKVAALTETGFESLKTPDWWTRTLAPVLAKHAVSYVLVWRNAHNIPTHFYAPFPGQQSADDFVVFYNDPRTLFARDLNGRLLTAE
ncbi:MAG: beta-mannosidase [Prevotella sp.]|nr:beta-mannosidase [Prevotella sp.]